MKKIAVFLFTFTLILCVNANPADIVTVKLDLPDNSSAAGQIHAVKARAVSEPGPIQNTRAFPESVAMLFLGSGLVSLGAFVRKKRSRR